MLYPTKHSHPDRTVIAVATLILKRLKSQRVESFTELYDLIKKTTPGSEVLFEASITFLYALELIRYRSKTDAFELVGQA